jgi:hypothetical protein
MIVTQPIPNFVGGVSQQPEDLRLPNQVQTAINVEYSPTEGAVKRYPTNHIAEVDALELAGAALFPLDREDTSHLVIIGDEYIKVFEDDGTEVLVFDSTNGPTYVADFSYLANANRDTIRAQSIVDTLFVSNRLITVDPAAGATYASWVDNGEAGVFVRQAGYSIDYQLKFKFVGIGTTYTVSYRTDSARSYDPAGAASTVTVTSNGQTVFTVPAAQQPFNAVADLTFSNAVGTGTVGPTSFVEGPAETEITYIGSPAWTAGDTFDVEREVAVVRSHRLRTNYIAKRLRDKITALSIANLTLEGSDADSSFRMSHSTAAFEIFEATDSVGNTYMTGFTDTIDNLSSLPTVFKGGAIVKVGGGTPESEDDYYARFTADSGAEVFGQGRWSEYTLPDGAGSFDADTMPHILMRAQDDALGTVTGDPDSFYFDWHPFTWDIRVAGDSESNPEPSFVGDTIQDLFWWNNRLGMLSTYNVILSEAGNQSNFWRTTVISLPDSDPIDIASTEDEGAALLHAIPLDTRLFVFSKQSQLILSGNPVLSPRTVEAPVVAKFQSIAELQPVLIGRSVFFAYPTAVFAGVRELVPGNESLQFGDIDIAAAVPKYITAGEGRLVGIDGKLFYTVDTDPSSLYCYCWFRSGGELILSAWAKMTFSGEIIDICVLDERLYVLSAHAGKSYLEYMNLGPGQTDADSDIVVRLDRKIDDGDIGPGLIVYDIPTDTTAVQLPYDFDAGDDIVAVEKETGGILQIDSVDDVTSTLVIQGDQTGKDLWFGVQYPMSMQLTRPNMRIFAGRGEVAVKSGATVIQALLINVDNTGFLEAQVQYRDGDPYSYPFTGGELGSVGAGLELTDLQSPNQITRDGTLVVPILADPKNFIVTLVNGSPLPSQIVSGEWEIRHLRRTGLRT